MKNLSIKTLETVAKQLDSLEDSVNEAVRSGHVMLEGRAGDVVVLRVVKGAHFER